MVVTKEIERSYIRVFDGYRVPKAGPDTLVANKAYFQALENGYVDNSRTSADLPSLADENGIKDEDLPFARLGSSYARIVGHLRRSAQCEVAG